MSPLQPSAVSLQMAELAARRVRPGKRDARSRVIDIQDLLLADIRNPETPAAIRAQCARAYDVLEDRLRVLSGKPLPGQMRPDLDKELALRRQAKIRPAWLTESKAVSVSKPKESLLLPDPSPPSPPPGA
jgi:hypothetical protein